MKKRLLKILSLLMIAVLLSLYVQPVKADVTVSKIGREDHEFVEPPAYVKPGAPTVYSDTAIVVELNSGVILYAKNINQRMYPASITKIMTALLTLENCDYDETITVSHAAVTDLVEGGADGRGRFYEGQTFTVKDALYALCLDSVNTVGYALAEHIDGSLSAFAARMNARAQEAGAFNTTFNNPHGLNDDLHMTTAFDMAKILWAAVDLADYRVIAGAQDYSFYDGQNHLIEDHHNYRVLQPDDEFYDERVVCGKTGWITEAGYTRAMYATDGNLDIICVTFHAETSYEAYVDGRNLLDYAFNNYSLISVPNFGDRKIMTAQVPDDNTQMMRTVEFTVPMNAKAETVTGAALLVPRSYLSESWELQLELRGDELRAVGLLGGVPLVSFPVAMTVVEEASLPETTEAPPTEAPEPSSEKVLPTVPVEPATKASEEPATKASEQPTQESEPDPGEKSGNGWLTFGFIAACVLLLISLGALGVVGYQNKILKERMNRRKALKKQKEER